MLYEHMTSYSLYSIITGSGTQQVNFMEKFCVKAGISCRFILFVSERSERDTLSRSSMENAIRIYIYIYRHVRHTFVARPWGDVMWEELSVSHF